MDASESRSAACWGAKARAWLAEAGRTGSALPLLLIATLICVVFAQIAAGSLAAHDTDLWYHLAAGRFIAETGTLPVDAFFSFVEPSPAQLDYYWAFQLFVYGLHSAFGPSGLVGVLALSWLGLALLVLSWVWRSGARGPWLAAVVTLVALAFLERFLVLRPHIASYLVLAGALWILEYRRGSLWPLPLLALVQANLHGVEYPVLLALLGAYGSEILWDVARERRRPERSELRRAGWITAAGLALLATPHGVDLLAMPFVPLPWASLFIPELAPRAAEDWGLFAVQGFVPDRSALLHALLALAAVGGLSALGRTPLRPAHWLLAAAALVLLPRADRFSSEAALLLLPLLSVSPVPVAAVRPWPLALRIVGWAAALSLVLHFAGNFFRMECRGAICEEGLPVGNTRWLLAHASPGERVFHHPNHGGYLEALLYGRQRLFVDMQTPFLFSAADVLRAHRALDDPDALAGVIAQYAPDYLLVSIEGRTFPRGVARREGYVPVFVDDAAVLYARVSSDPARARTWALTAIDPWNPSRPSGTAEQVLHELARMREVDGGSARTLTLASLVALDLGRTERALELAGRLDEGWPMRVEGPRLVGQALLAVGRPAEACAAFERALERNRALFVPDRPGRVQLYGELAGCREAVGDPAGALAALRRAIPDPFRQGTDAAALLHLARAHRRAGSAARARDLIAFARILADPADAALAAALSEEARALNQ